MDPNNLFLQKELRSELEQPIGELIEGTIEETVPILFTHFSDFKDILVGVGDVTSELLVTNNFNPDLVITDGLNKREVYSELTFPGYHILRANSPAANITLEAWKSIIKAYKLILGKKKVHIIINGEEDLLVLPVLVEFPLKTKIIYGQPNVGCVIRTLDENSRDYAINFLKRMDKID